MSAFGALTATEQMEKEVDVVGGGGPLDTDVYEGKVSMAYLVTSTKGAKGMYLAVTINGREVRETVYATTGDAKKNVNFYVKDGKQYPLPGFTLLNNLALLATQKELKDLVPEEKTVNVYNKEAQKEIPTKVMVFTELLDVDVLVALFRETKIKQVKDAAGNYVDNPTGETYDSNAFEKFYHATNRKTVVEILAGAEATFIDTWLAKWAGVTKGAKAGKVAANDPAGGATNAKPTKSLFA